MDLAIPLGIIQPVPQWASSFGGPVHPTDPRAEKLHSSVLASVPYGFAPPDEARSMSPGSFLSLGLVISLASCFKVPMLLASETRDTKSWVVFAQKLKFEHLRLWNHSDLGLHPSSSPFRLSDLHATSRPGAPRSPVRNEGAFTGHTSLGSEMRSRTCGA